MLKSTKGNKKSPIKSKPSVKDYGSDPFFVEKANQSRLFLQKHGFPKEIVKKKQGATAD